MATGAGGALGAPTALFLVVSLTCQAPPRDPNQCELVDRPRYRKGPHICFDYNATVRGAGGTELALALGRAGGVLWGGRAMGGSQGSRAEGEVERGKQSHGCPPRGTGP